MAKIEITGNIKDKKFHFIAIGGIGMSGLAKYLIEAGCDAETICRRLIAQASEDIGMADSQCQGIGGIVRDPGNFQRTHRSQNRSDLFLGGGPHSDGGTFGGFGRIFENRHSANGSGSGSCAPRHAQEHGRPDILIGKCRLDGSGIRTVVFDQFLNAEDPMIEQKGKK